MIAFVDAARPDGGQRHDRRHGDDLIDPADVAPRPNGAERREQLDPQRADPVRALPRRRHPRHRAARIRVVVALLREPGRDGVCRIVDEGDGSAP